MELKYELCSIRKVIDDACDTLDSWAKSKSIKLLKKVQPDIPQLELDYNRIIQVLNNLIGNAIKFTPRNGTITVEAGTDEKGKGILVSVIDTGVGIAQEDLDKVFDKFQQVGERMATDISGTGLGLSITKEIVELHGGIIWVESAKGKGAKFSFTLPFYRP